MFLGSIFLALRNKILVLDATLLIAVWLLLVPYTPLLIAYFSKENSVAISDTGFSVLNYNVHSFAHKGNNFKKRIALSEEIEDVIRKKNASIVCLQEYSDRWRKAYLDTTFLQSYPYKTPVTTAGSIPRVYSKFPILDSELLFFNKSNGALAATILLGEDTLSVINCHLKSHVLTKDLFYNEYFFPKNFDIFYKMNKSNMIINHQLEIILNYVATNKYPVIIVGDMNIVPFSYFYRRLKIDFNNSYETSGSGNWATLNKRGLMSFVQIDHQFYSKELINYNYQIDQSVELSDHFPCMGWYAIKK